jgi:hypothetical protein
VGFLVSFGDGSGEGSTFFFSDFEDFFFLDDFSDLDFDGLCTLSPSPFSPYHDSRGTTTNIMGTQISIVFLYRKSLTYPYMVA